CQLKQGRILHEVSRAVDDRKIRSTATGHLGPINAANLKKAHAQLETGSFARQGRPRRCCLISRIEMTASTEAVDNNIWLEVDHRDGVLASAILMAKRLDPIFMSKGDRYGRTATFCPKLQSARLGAQASPSRKPVHR